VKLHFCIWQIVLILLSAYYGSSVVTGQLI